MYWLVAAHSRCYRILWRVNSSSCFKLNIWLLGGFVYQFLSFSRKCRFKMKKVLHCLFLGSAKISKRFSSAGKWKQKLLCLSKDLVHHPVWISREYDIASVFCYTYILPGVLKNMITKDIKWRKRGLWWWYACMLWPGHRDCRSRQLRGGNVHWNV